MKIRKGLLAAATAAAVSVSGVVAAPAFAADENTGNDTNTTTPKNNEGNTTPGTGEGNEGENGDGNTDTGKGGSSNKGDKEKSSASDTIKEMFYNDKGKLDPKLITAWIAVFTAILGLIGNVITFAQKNFKLPK